MFTFPPQPGDDESPAISDPVILTSVSRPPRVDHELSIVPGASASDVASALTQLPADVVLVDHYGDLDLTIVFR